MIASATSSSISSSSSSSSARDDAYEVVTEINTTSASPPLKNEDDDGIRQASSSSSISALSSSSTHLYSSFTSLTFPFKFCTFFISMSPSSFFVLSIILSVLVSPAFAAEEWSLNCQQTLYFGALNRSATLQCRVTGVNLYSTAFSLASVKWIKVSFRHRFAVFAPQTE